MKLQSITDQFAICYQHYISLYLVIVFDLYEACTF